MIDPAIHVRGWTEDLIRREESAGAIEIIGGQARSDDLKAVNPTAKRDQDTRTPEELLDLIEARGHEVAEALVALRRSRSEGPRQLTSDRPPSSAGWHDFGNSPYLRAWKATSTPHACHVVGQGG